VVPSALAGTSTRAELGVTRPPDNAANDGGGRGGESQPPWHGPNSFGSALWQRHSSITSREASQNLPRPALSTEIFSSHALPIAHRWHGQALSIPSRLDASLSLTLLQRRRSGAVARTGGFHRQAMRAGSNTFIETDLDRQVVTLDSSFSSGEPENLHSHEHDPAAGLVAGFATPASKDSAGRSGIDRRRSMDVLTAQHQIQLVHASQPPESDASQERRGGDPNAVVVPDAVVSDAVVPANRPFRTTSGDDIPLGARYDCRHAV